jgi:hypothetical protein
MCRVDVPYLDVDNYTVHCEVQYLEMTGISMSNVMVVVKAFRAFYFEKVTWLL